MKSNYESYLVKKFAISSNRLSNRIFKYIKNIIKSNTTSIMPDT